MLNLLRPLYGATFLSSRLRLSAHRHSSLRSMATISPFITSPGSPLESLLPGYHLAQPATSSPTTAPYAVFSQDIVKSPNDDRMYK